MSFNDNSRFISPNLWQNCHLLLIVFTIKTISFLQKNLDVCVLEIIVFDIWCGMTKSNNTDDMIIMTNICIIVILCLMWKETKTSFKLEQRKKSHWIMMSMLKHISFWLDNCKMILFIYFVLLWKILISIW